MKVNVLSFTNTMSSLLNANMSLQDALRISKEIETYGGNKKLCSDLWGKINEGFLLSDILSSYGNYFSDLYVSLVKIGEETDSLKLVFERLTEYLKAKKETRTKIVQSLIYPCMVLFSTFMVVLIVMFLVFPRLEVIFEAFSSGSDSVMKQVDKIRNGMKITGFASVFLIICSAVMVSLYKLSEKIAEHIDGLLLKFPVIGKYIRTSQTRDFSFSMKLLCGSYYEFTLALKHSANVIRNRKYRKAVEDVHRRIYGGDGIGESFEIHKEFPPYLVTWIKLAEVSGTPEKVFAEVYDYYSTSNQNFISAFSAGVEPAFILIAGLIVIYIISKFVIPIFNLMGNL